jgi:anti-sigma factor RsiW
VVELVTDYLEEAMPARDRRRFERHLRNCPGCTRYVHQVRLTADALGHVHPEPPTGPTRDALVQAFKDFRRH